MKTLILTCNTGEGHNSTARAILETYEANGEFCVVGESFAFLSKKLSVMIGKGHATMYRHTPKIFDKGYAISEKHDGAFTEGSFLQRFFSYGSRNLYEFVTSNSIDNIICVHPFSAILVGDMCKRFDVKNITLSIVSTDYTCAPGTNGTELDYYFIPHKKLIPEFISNGIPEGKIRVSGIPVKDCFYVKLERSKARSILGLHEDKNIIVMCCGSMGCGPMEKVAKKLSLQISDNDLLIVICGSNKRLLRKLDKIRSDKVKIIGYTSQMKEYMCACNVFLTKPGGISTTEGANLKVPMVFINAVAGCELRNREFYSSIDCAVLTSDSDDVVMKCLELLHSPERIKVLTQNLDKEFTMTGAKYILSTLSEVKNQTEIVEPLSSK